MKLALTYALLLLTGCAGTWLTAGPGTAAFNAPRDGTSSKTAWATSTQDLLYVADTRTVTVYSYPQGELQRTLRHFYLATGLCADTKGDVFVVDTGYGKIFEYAHGGTTRIATLGSPSADPVGCAIDRITGNLAVSTQGNDTGAIEIFKGARGKPVIYNDSSFYQFYFCTYDSKGNLFSDGLTGRASGDFGIAELPKGSGNLSNISINQYVSWPGGVAWDGRYLAVGDENNPFIYQVAIKAHAASVVATMHLGSGAHAVKQFWLQGQTLIAPNEYDFKKGLRSDVLFYKYPIGGPALRKITEGVMAAGGAVVSLATK
jgi:hypothetical protein